MELWQIVVIAVVVSPFVLYILWRHRLAMPIFLVSAIFLRKYYKDQWAGEKTARYTKGSEKGTLWWGYNRKTRHGFIIFSGKGGHKSWQIQNWQPRHARW